MARWHHAIQRAAGAHPLAVDRTPVLDIGLRCAAAVEGELAAGINDDVVARHRHNPLDVGIAGRILQAGDRAQQGQVDEQAAQGRWPVVGLQHRIKVMGSMEDHNLAPSGRPVAIAEFFHQEAVLDLQAGQHGSRRDIAGLQ